MVEGLTGVWNGEFEGRLGVMVDVAIAAGRHTLKYFRSDSLVVDSKGDQSPVTIADREAEQLTRKLIEARFPSDTIAGEEFDEQSGTSEFRWTVDPIDGTKSFICGVPLYSTLLSLERAGEPLGGAIILPALGEAVVAATGLGCHYTSDFQRWTSPRVSQTKELSKAVFVTSEAKSFGKRGSEDVYTRLQDACRLTRTWGDGYGYFMIATGRADIMVDPICNAWDVAAMLPILGQAGGRFTDWKGEPTPRSGDGVGTNGHLHDQVLKLLA